MRISFIAALDRNNLIGAEGKIPWKLPADLKYFKSVTMGKPIIMGRKTYESIGKPLPGRTNIVVTRNPDYVAPGCTVVHSITEALDAASGAAEVMIIGGSQLYEQLLPVADRLYLTYVDGVFVGDTYFPSIAPERWQVVSEEAHGPDEHNPFSYRYVVLERRDR